jgi:hypothetical protein
MSEGSMKLAFVVTAVRAGPLEICGLLRRGRRRETKVSDEHMASIFSFDYQFGQNTILHTFCN